MSEDTGMRIGLEGGKRKMKRFFSELKYGAYLTVHPFKGFWDIKHEHAGSVGTAGFFLAVYTVLSVVGGYCTGYLFNAYEKQLSGIQAGVYCAGFVFWLLYLQLGIYLSF